ncbi:MAG: hypothetical protein RMX35_04430 [Nostoc sp. DcaGUA01]|nr:hypothetical protein [Nostoc sp. DcaGUA01]
MKKGLYPPNIGIGRGAWALRAVGGVGGVGGWKEIFPPLLPTLPHSRFLN